MVKPKGRMALQIRRAKGSDIPGLVFVEKECFDSYYREHRFKEAQFADYLNRKGAILFVAVFDSSLVGYVAASVKNSRSQLSAWLDSIAVLPASRRRGIGYQLMRRFTKEAKRRACKSVMLQVAAANENGILFFSRQGFRKVRHLPGYYGKGLDGILMKLDI